MTKEEIEQELQQIKDDCNEFSEQMIIRINDLCNKMPYHDGSKFSYRVDRLDLFIRELNEFTPNGD